MSIIEPFTPEGIDPNSSYLATCINRVNTNYKTATINNFLYINVRDYGAVGDNIADDTSAINAAIAALSSDVSSVLYFPRGTYKISSKIEIINKNNLLIISNGASIRHTTGTDTLWINTCTNVKIVGLLYIYTETTGITSQALVLRGNTYCNFTNIHISGDFLYGIRIWQDTGFIANTITATINGCRNGIFVNSGSEYYNIIGCCISNCDIGISCTGPNIHINSCEINANRIGVYILGDSSVGNTDNCSIVDCSVNQNRACGIFLKNLSVSMLISGNYIRANNGPDDLVEAININAQSFHFGIYLEKVTSVSIVNNVFISNNDMDIGTDGMRNSIINNNIFRGGLGNKYPIYEWNTSGTLNYYNQICNNIFSGASSVSFIPSLNRIFLNTSNDYAYNYIIKNNNGENLDNDLNITTNSGNYYIGAANNYIIDGLVVSTTDASNPSGQTANIHILSHATGTKFKIIFSKLSGASNYTWLRYITTSTNTPNITGTGVSYFTSNKCFRFSNIWYAEFTPLSKNVFTNWNVFGGV
jgi:hypothetical protein